MAHSLSLTVKWDALNATLRGLDKLGVVVIETITKLNTQGDRLAVIDIVSPYSPYKLQLALWSQTVIEDLTVKTS